VKPTAEVRILSLECLRQSEKDGDEIYCLFEGRGIPVYEIQQRFPQGRPNYWAFVNGQIAELDLVLFKGEISEPVEFRIELREDDTAGFSALPFLGPLITRGIDQVQENHIGQIKIQVHPNGAISWRAASATTATAAIQEMNEQIRCYDLTGAQAHYRIKLSVRFL
jgi:hypothetical protein